MERPVRVRFAPSPTGPLHIGCDREAVVRAFMSDPLVKGKKCGEKDIRQLVDDMLRATQRYLPEGWRGQIG